MTTREGARHLASLEPTELLLVFVLCNCIKSRLRGDEVRWRIAGADRCLVFCSLIQTVDLREDSSRPHSFSSHETTTRTIVKRYSWLSFHTYCYYQCVILIDEIVFVLFSQGYLLSDIFVMSSSSLSPSLWKKDAARERLTTTTDRKVCTFILT